MSCSLIGIAYGTIPRTAKSAAAIVNPPFVILQFISGVWVLDAMLPEPLRALGALFPLKWMAQGFRSVFLPDAFAAGRARRFLADAADDRGPRGLGRGRIGPVPGDLPVEDQGLRMAVATRLRGRRRGRNRWEWIRPALLGASIVVPLAGASSSCSNRPRRVAGGCWRSALAAAYAGWTLALDRKLTGRRGGDGQSPPMWATVYFVGLFVLFGAMVLVDPVFFFVAFLVYWQIFASLDLVPASAVVVAFSAEMIALQLHHSDRSLADDPVHRRGHGRQPSGSPSPWPPGSTGSSSRAGSEPTSSASSRRPGPSWRR